MRGLGSSCLWGSRCGSAFSSRPVFPGPRAAHPRTFSGPWTRPVFSARPTSTSSVTSRFARWTRRAGFFPGCCPRPCASCRPSGLPTAGRCGWRNWPRNRAAPSWPSPGCGAGSRSALRPKGAKGCIPCPRSRRGRCARKRRPSLMCCATWTCTASRHRRSCWPISAGISPSPSGRSCARGWSGRWSPSSRRKGRMDRRGRVFA